MNSLIQIKKTIKDYKNLRASRYIPVRGDEIGTRVFELDKYYVSSKIDGHLCFLINYKDNKLICNYNGNSFDRPELLDDFLKIAGDNEGVFVGEIFSYKENDRTRSFELKKHLSDKKSDIRIGVFDIIESQNETFSENDWIRKKKILNSVFSKSELIFAVKELELKSRKDIQNEFNSRVNERNEEGLIVRGESGPVFKIKPTLNFDFVIMGYVVGYTDDPTLLKELLFGVNLEKDKFLIIGKVSSGFSIDDRKKMVPELEKIQVDANIIEVSGSKIPFTMVDPIHVAEIDAIDIINSNTSGIISKSVLKFKNKEYSKEKNSPSISLISPIFKGLREDKKSSIEDTGLNQISRVIDLNEEKEAAALKKISKIICKEVYVKEMKGAKMVKKFFVWETNGDEQNYPKFVFYQIDYSPTRADKLKREIKVSNSKDQIEQIFKQNIESDIKSGWNKI